MRGFDGWQSRKVQRGIVGKVFEALGSLVMDGGQVEDAGKTRSTRSEV